MSLPRPDERYIYLAHEEMTLHVIVQPSMVDAELRLRQLSGRKVTPGEDFANIYAEHPEWVHEALFPYALCGSTAWQIKDGGVGHDELLCGKCMDLSEEGVEDHNLMRNGLALLPYSLYLQTAHWQRIRAKALDHYGDSCILCNARPVEVHHRTYERLGNEELTDLIVLCATCHGTFHGKLA